MTASLASSAVAIAQSSPQALPAPSATRVPSTRWHTLFWTVRYSQATDRYPLHLDLIAFVDVATRVRQLADIV